MRIVVLALLLCASAAPAGAQVFHGRLVDEATDRPIAAATINLLSDSTRLVDATLTDSVGYFLVAAEAAGEFRLRAQRIGYPPTISTPLNMSMGDTLEVEFRISAVAILLDPVVVTARRRKPPPMIEDFYERAEQGIWGTFVTRAEIERIRPMRTTDLLRRIPGIMVTPMAFGGGAEVQMRGGCEPMVIVDGMRVRQVISIDHLAQPLELEGLEVYRSFAQVPVEFGGMRPACGAVLIWTRRGD